MLCSHWETEGIWREVRLALACDVCVVILVVSCEEEQGVFSHLSCPKPFRSVSLFLMFFSISASGTLTESLLHVGFHLGLRALEQNIQSLR